MINSNDFDLTGFTPYLLSLAAEASSKEFQLHYKGKYGMLRSEWRVIFHLGNYGPMHAREICERSRTHKTKISRAVAALRQKRFITVKQNSDDRRLQLLELTAKGENVFRDLLEAAKSFDANLTADFKEQEIAILQKCLKRIAGI